MSRAALNRLLISIFMSLNIFWLLMPIAMALLWSLVDPNYAWSYPDVFPKVLSFRRWGLLWETTLLKQALWHSYLLAGSTAVVTLVLSMPTAYAFGRLDFKGKGIAQVLILVPLVIPGFAIAIFFSSLLFSMGVQSKFLGILIGHSVFTLPYALRILTVSFSQVRQDLIDAARDLGASGSTVMAEVFWPAIKPGILASAIITFVYSIEEFAMSFVIGSPDFITVPTLLFSYLGYQFVRPNAAVVSLILVVPNVLLMVVLERMLKVANPATIVAKG